MKTLTSALALTVALLAACAAKATTYYVATTGSDSANGSLATPFATIGRASQVVRPGDEVQVRGGVYRGQVTITAKGTSAGRIAFRNYPGETPILDGASTPTDSNLLTIYQSAFVDVSGFEVRNAKRIGICGYTSNNIRILNNTVHDSIRNGIYVSDSAMFTTTDVVIDGNVVRNNVLENQYHTWSGGWAAGIVVARADRTRITNNRVFQNDGEGIIFILSNNGVAEGNVVYDNFSVGIYLDNARFTRVNRNFIYNTGNSRYYRGGEPFSGIGVANESYDATNPSSDLTITNNVVLNTKWGFYYGAYGRGGGLRNATVANNTFYRASSTMLWIQNDKHANSVIENNIFYQVGGRGMADVAGAGVTYRSNDWYGATPGGAAGAGDVIGDPRFVNAGGLNAEDYRLTSGSPAIQTALDVGAIVATDYFGSPRTLPFDMGAHENSSGAPVTPLLAPPASVTATADSATSARIAWTAVPGAASYHVYRNGTKVRSANTSTSWSDAALSANTTYAYEVSSVDASGRESAKSAATSVKTPAATVVKRRSVRG